MVPHIVSTDSDATRIKGQRVKVLNLPSARSRGFACWEYTLRIALSEPFRDKRLNDNRERAIEQFLARMRGKGLAFATFRLGNEDTALDLLQEAMIGFVKAVDDYDEEAWTNLFYKILTRRITDWQRKTQWRQKLAHISLFSQFGGSQNDEDDNENNYEAGRLDTESEDPVQADLMSGELAAKFEAALRALPARQQEAYLLRQWQGVSTRDAASIMRCSEGSIKTHLSRAMTALREALSDWVDGDH